MQRLMSGVSGALPPWRLMPTVLLLVGAGRSAAVLSLAAQRVVMTAIGGLLAMLLTAIVMRPAPRGDR